MAHDDSSQKFSTRVLWSFLYSGVGNTASKVINVVALFVVLKLISAASFGVASIVLAIFAVVKAVTELGLGVAIVQAEDLSRREIDSLFWLSLGASVLLYGLLAAAAPLAATFYDDPQFTSIIRIYGLIVVLFSFYFVPRNLLTRDLAFGQLAVIDNLALLSSSALMVLFGYLGYGAWAIIIGEMANRVGLMVLCHVFRPYVPRLQFSWKEVKPLVSFGLYATGSRLLYNLYSNADYLIAGAVFSKEAVGVYTLAYRIVSDPVRTLANNVNQVAYPAFSRLQDELERLRRYFFTIARGSLLIIGLLLVVIGLYIDEILTAGGYEKYLGAVPLVQVLAAVGVLRAVSPLVPRLLNAVGQARLNFYYSLSNAIFMPLAFVVGAQFGLMGMAWAWMIGYPGVVGLLFYFGARELELSLPAFVARAFSGLTLLLPLAALGFGLQLALERLTPFGDTLTLALGVSLTLALGLGAAYWRERETIALLRGNRKDVPEDPEAAGTQAAAEAAEAPETAEAPAPENEPPEEETLETPERSA